MSSLYSRTHPREHSKDSLGQPSFYLLTPADPFKLSSLYARRTGDLGDLLRVGERCFFQSFDVSLELLEVQMSYLLMILCTFRSCHALVAETFVI